MQLLIFKVIRMSKNKPYAFMVPPYTLDVSTIILNHLSVGHGVGSSYDSIDEAIDAMVSRLNEIRGEINEPFNEKL